MKVLVVGNGGREHALAWKISSSPLCEELFCASGNAGTADVAQNVDVSPEDVDALFTFARENRIDLTVVGPEAPLVAGIADRFRKGGLRLFGPVKKAAMLEGSKVFAKELMRRHNIPTAKFQVFDKPANARRYLADQAAYPLVVKADGLAAGKGVAVCKDKSEADEMVSRIMDARKFGAAGDRLIIEDCLAGEESSILAVSDGRNILVLPSSQDHKRAFDGDKGPNTGGMGAYCPAPVVTAELMDTVERMVLVPTIHAIGRDGSSFCGLLYAGIMATRSGPKVLEYNVRFGDPEAQPVLTMIESDLLEMLVAAVEGKLDEVQLKVRPGYSVCVVMASEGYPGSYSKGRKITGIGAAEKVDGVKVFHGGTVKTGGVVFTNGGRVLGVTAHASTLQDAKQKAYEAVALIDFEGCHYRKDIADRGIARLKKRSGPVKE